MESVDRTRVAYHPVLYTTFGFHHAPLTTCFADTAVLRTPADADKFEANSLPAHILSSHFHSVPLSCLFAVIFRR